ncbi:Uncharacterized protein dnm_043990 [Desulfonema magnum]|uniref:Uncharacterized protein n=1 Tax=Desulfonema magnum TaxID=45655 RepID=A0A975BMV3_9BACT|nr:Uncharacterized protein dnm_043990 [Desulfonema magnum]
MSGIRKESVRYQKNFLKFYVLNASEIQKIPLLTPALSSALKIYGFFHILASFSVLQIKNYLK